MQPTQLYDITRSLSPSVAVWPGDTPLSYEPLMQIDQGASVNLTTLHLSAHSGTHADAYYHYEADGAHPATMPLDAYFGPAVVITIARRDGGITPDEIAGIDFYQTPRVLFHSHVSDLADDHWPGEFPWLTVELIDYLADRGVRLIGLDSPSVDPLDSKEMACHHRLHELHMVNLESLALGGVPDGRYELIALPLRLTVGCASPVRAVLRGL